MSVPTTAAIAVDASATPMSVAVTDFDPGWHHPAVSFLVIQEVQFARIDVAGREHFQHGQSALLR